MSNLHTIERKLDWIADGIIGVAAMLIYSFIKTMPDLPWFAALVAMFLFAGYLRYNYGKISSSSLDE